MRWTRKSGQVLRVLEVGRHALSMMKHKPLVFCTRFFHDIETLAFAGALVPMALAMSRWFLWPLVVLVLPLTLALACVWALSQCIGSFAAWTLHGRIGTRASLCADGLNLDGESLRNPRFIAWEEVVLVRRVYERFFLAYDTRFGDAPAYQLELQLGEVVFADFVDEDALRSRCLARGIATEGFDSRLAAAQFAPLDEQLPG